MVLIKLLNLYKINYYVYCWVSRRVWKSLLDRKICFYIDNNDFDDYESIVDNQDCLKVLDYYRIRREDAEEELANNYNEKIIL